MHIDALDYDLPEELIAQSPPERREDARLLIVARSRGVIRHASIRDLPDLLPPTLFVVNDTRVFPARLFGTRETGGKIEFLLLERLEGSGHEETWTAFARPGKSLRKGASITIGEGVLTATVLEKSDAVVTVRLTSARSVSDAIETVGAIPLPPYIQRRASAEDRERYQTIFAKESGSVAAPTAGLHFSPELVAALSSRGHRFARVTLHVGPGTFQPLRTSSLDAHAMHTERFFVPPETAAAIAEARDEGRLVLGIGTTSLRALESALDEHGRVQAKTGATALFIRPPYQVQSVDALLTNFHLPRSTLLALVMAFAGIDPIRNAYEEAVGERYRFFSYGDAMLLLPDR